jgi:plastocyanin
MTVVLRPTAILFAVLLAPAFARAAPPVYVHMNGGNYFLEPVVAVRPGQEVVFVNQDTDAHTIVGYHPSTGAISQRFNKTVLGTKGLGHPVHTYTVLFPTPGLEAYFCSVHAALAPTFGKAVQPVKQVKTGGFKGPMAGLVIVTTDPALLSQNPPTTAVKTVTGFFGG